jgi:hypothetical protein
MALCVRVSQIWETPSKSGEDNTVTRKFQQPNLDATVIVTGDDHRASKQFQRINRFTGTSMKRITADSSTTTGKHDLQTCAHQEFATKLRRTCRWRG